MCHIFSEGLITMREVEPDKVVRDYEIITQYVVFARGLLIVGSKINEPIMKSTKFHTADENSLGRFVGINKSVRPSTPTVSRTKAGVGDSRRFRLGDH